MSQRSEEERAKPPAKARDLLEEHMTPAQLAEAQGLAREWRPKGE